MPYRNVNDYIKARSTGNLESDLFMRISNLFLGVI